MRASVGWTFVYTVLAVGSLNIFFQAALAEPAVPETSCEAQCQAVLEDCKRLCVEIVSGEMSDYKGASDERGGNCVAKCEADLDVCRKNC